MAKPEIFYVTSTQATYHCQLSFRLHYISWLAVYYLKIKVLIALCFFFFLWNTDFDAFFTTCSNKYDDLKMHWMIGRD